MALTSEIRVRVDPLSKEKAMKTLEKMGLNLSDLVRITLNRVAQEGRVPFEIKVPNAKTQAAMEAALRGEGVEYQTPDEFFKSAGI